MITRQVDALRAIAQEPHQAVSLIPAWRGAFHPPEADGQTIPARVWERLLDRGDLEVLDAFGAGRFKVLVLTDQGRARISAG